MELLDLQKFMLEALAKALTDAGLQGRVAELAVYPAAEDGVYEVVAVTPENDMDLVQAVGEAFSAFRMKFYDAKFKTILLDLAVPTDREQYSVLSANEEIELVGV